VPFIRPSVDAAPIFCRGLHPSHVQPCAAARLRDPTRFGAPDRHSSLTRYRARRGAPFYDLPPRPQSSRLVSFLIEPDTLAVAHDNPSVLPMHPSCCSLMAPSNAAGGSGSPTRVASMMRCAHRADMWPRVKASIGCVSCSWYLSPGARDLGHYQC